MEPRPQADDGAHEPEILPSEKGDKLRGDKKAARAVVTIDLKPFPLGAPGPAQGVPPKRSRRGVYAAAAFSVAAGAVAGYLVGAHTGVRPAVEAGLRIEAASLSQALPWKTEIAAGAGDRREVARLTDEMRFLRAEMEQLRRNAETARPAPGPAAGAETAARLDRIEGRLGRLERDGADKSPTSSVAPAERPAAAKPEERRAEPEQAAKAGREQDLRGRYSLREVSGGLALVADRYGAVEIVGPGDDIPGGGRVLSIERRGRQWVVVTTRGVIAPGGF